MKFNAVTSGGTGQESCFTSERLGELYTESHNLCTCMCRAAVHTPIRTCTRTSCKYTYTHTHTQMRPFRHVYAHPRVARV